MSPTGDLIVTFIFAGEVFLELAQEPLRVAPELHQSGRSPPFRVTIMKRGEWGQEVEARF